MTTNLALNTLSELQQLPSSDDIARKKIIIRYIDRLTAILCGGDAESFWQEWAHPCSGLDHNPIRIPGVTPSQTQQQNTVHADTDDPIRSSAYYFTLYIMPIVVHDFGPSMANRLSEIYCQINDNLTYSKSGERRVWRDVDKIVQMQDELFDIIRTMNMQLYAPTIRFTHIQPTIMSYEAKIRIFYTALYIIAIIKITLFSE